MMRLLLATILTLAFAAPAAAQYSTTKPRRQFVTLGIDWMNTEPLHFADHPLEDLVGRRVASAQNQTFEYQTRDEQIQIDVLQFRKRNKGLSLAIYPFGLSSGTTFGLRATTETLPIVRIAFAGTDAPADYSFTGGQAYDVGAGLFVADRSTGWGLGSQAFIVGGVGRIKAENGMDGNRTFVEGGGGLLVGPLGVQIGVKFAWNTVDEPVKHKFLTIPITVRGTLSF